MKAAVLVLVVAAGLITQVGTANTAVFYLRSLQLEQSWRSAEAAGVPGARLESPRAALRSLDAIHLATAQTAASTAQLTALVTYDSRLREAADALGLATAAPGKTP